jgi:hypothetical protein
MSSLKYKICVENLRIEIIHTFMLIKLFNILCLLNQITSKIISVIFSTFFIVIILLDKTNY